MEVKFDLARTTVIRDNHPYHLITKSLQPLQSSLPLPFSWRYFLLFEIPPRELLSGDHGCYSCSSDASQSSEPPEAQLIHTLSKFHLLLHELYPIIHHSSLEHAICGTYYLLLAFLNLTTGHLSNLRSINLI